VLDFVTLINFCDQSGRRLLASTSSGGNSEGVINHAFSVNGGTLHATEADGTSDTTDTVAAAIAIPIGVVGAGECAHTFTCII
jgi:hypothetical protein